MQADGQARGGDGESAQAHDDKFDRALFNSWLSALEAAKDIHLTAGQLSRNPNPAIRRIGAVFTAHALPIPFHVLGEVHAVAARWLQTGIVDDAALNAIVDSYAAIEDMLPALTEMVDRQIIKPNWTGAPLWLAAFNSAAQVSDTLLTWHDAGKTRDPAWRAAVQAQQADGAFIFAKSYGLEAGELS